MRKIRILALMLAAGISAITAESAAADYYTLDGVKTPPATAMNAAASGGGCAASAASSGEVACFTSEASRSAAEVAALRANTVPPGYGAMPKPEIRQAILGRVIQAKSSGIRVKAAQDGCQRDYTHVYTGYDFGGSYGYFAYQPSWTNHTPTFNNSISSYKASSLQIPYWHDLANGQGAYYNLANICRLVTDLSLGSWDNRFTSYVSL